MKSVKIGAHKFPILAVDRVDGSDDYWAMYYPHELGQKIEISKDLAGSKWAEILLHEIGHGIVNECGYAFPGDEEEKFIEGFARVLTQVMGDNKTLIRQILKALK
jgi:hypothetical protein